MLVVKCGSILSRAPVGDNVGSLGDWTSEEGEFTGTHMSPVITLVTARREMDIGLPRLSDIGPVSR